MKEFKELVEIFEKGENDLALGDYLILGEESALIKAMGEQLALYTYLISDNGCYKKGMHVQIPLDALWGLGRMIIKIGEEMDEKINILDERFLLKIREERRGV
ncbi:MAG: hypothetical protein OEV42_14995 [Deltaproteobacteria bacterium]|nr:hypothetical protein [Deltaproteobacteria bacterium]